MKKPVYYFLVIIIANILFVEFYFTLDIFRMIAFIAILALVYTIPKFSDAFALLLVRKSFSQDKIHLPNTADNKKIKIRAIIISATIVILLAGFHLYGYWHYFKFLDEDLTDKGIYTPAIVTDKKQEIREEHNHTYYIYYTYRYNGQIFKHHCQNNAFEVGDTIVVKFAPGNPDHHIIMDKNF